MRGLIKKFFSKNATESLPQQGNDINLKIRVATCALLLEMANIDDEFNEAEKNNIVNVLKSDFSLPDEDAEELLEISRKELDDSLDLWKFTNFINENYSSEEKIKVIETVWKVVYADGKLDMHEDYLVHKLSKLLKLSHKQLIDAKLKVLYNK